MTGSRVPCQSQPSLRTTNRYKRKSIKYKIFKNVVCVYKTTTTNLVFFRHHRLLTSIDKSLWLSANVNPHNGNTATWLARTTSGADTNDSAGAAQNELLCVCELTNTMRIQLAEVRGRVWSVLCSGSVDLHDKSFLIYRRHILLFNYMAMPNASLILYSSRMQHDSK